MNRIIIIRATLAVFGLSACSSAPKPDTGPSTGTRAPASSAAAANAPPPSSMNTTGFDPAKLVEGTDSYQAFANGQALGTATIALSREGANYRYVTDLVVQGGAMHQHTEGLFSAATLMPISQTVKYSIQGTPLTTNITVADGRATGRAQDPGPTGVVRTNVDLAVSPGTVDDQASAALILTLPLADGYAKSFTSLATSPSEIRANTLMVQGKETVTVPAGTFETYRVLVHSKEDATMYVTTTAPRRTVMVRVGNGVELRLVK